jgi:hypothetical protein
VASTLGVRGAAAVRPLVDPSFAPKLAMADTAPFSGGADQRLRIR